MKPLHKEDARITLGNLVEFYVSMHYMEVWIASMEKEKGHFLENEKTCIIPVWKPPF